MLVVYICLLSGYSPNKPKQKFEAKKAGASLPIFPLPIVPLMLSFSPHPSLSRTQRGLCGGERNTSKDYNDTRRPKKNSLKRKQKRHSLFIMEVHLAAMHDKSIHITL